MSKTKVRRRIRSAPLSATEIKRLETLRLQRRWTYRELADDVARVCGVSMPQPTITKALSGASVLPTTAYPLRQYLSQLAEATAS